MWAGVALYAGDDDGSGAPFWEIAGNWVMPIKKASSNGILMCAIGIGFEL
jgi:hypothetical protein